MAKPPGPRTAPEGGTVRAGDREIPFFVRRSARRKKTIELSLEPGRVVVAAPLRVPFAELQSIVVRRSAWILARLDSRPSPEATALHDGSVIPYRGTSIRLSVVPGPVRRASVALLEGRLRVSVPESASPEARRAVVHAAVTRWLREKAACIAREAIAAREPDTGTTAKAVLVRDQRRRWGSCSVDGTIRFNWRIAMLPSEFVDYIAVHELCHLRHPNHSPAFWAAVTSVLPNAKDLRKRLSEIRLPV